MAVDRAAEVRGEVTADLTGDQLRRVHEAVSWDDRKTLADLYQSAGGRVDTLDEATYDALIVVGMWAAAAVVRESVEL